MGWASTTRSRLAIVLGIPMHKAGFIGIDQGMASIEGLGAPYSQQAIDRIEALITQWESFQSAIDGIDLANSGVTKLDVIEFSDRPGAKLEDSYRLRDEIAKRIAMALGVDANIVTSSGSRGRSRS